MMMTADWWRWARRRVLLIVPVILLATFLVFGLLQLVPGDLAVTLAGEAPTPERIVEIRTTYGLDRPIIIQYLTWLRHVAEGDLSRSLLSGEPVTQSILNRLPNTLIVVFGSLTLSLMMGIPLGVSAAIRPGSRVDQILATVVSLGVALPSFWLAMILVSFFALELGWFPATGMVSLSTSVSGALWHAILPSVALSAAGAATVARQLRGALVEVLASPYVRTLRAKGLSPSSVLWKHGLKNVSVTLLTVIGLQINRLFSATVVVEVVFAIPGIGGLVVPAALAKDFPVVQGVVLTLAILNVSINFIVDGVIAYLDPRASLS
jgi:peptide/nickel transport system permease protein